MFEIDHFTVVRSVTWPLNGSETGGDLVFVKTLLVFVKTFGCVNQAALMLTRCIHMTKAERSVSK